MCIFLRQTVCCVRRTRMLHFCISLLDDFEGSITDTIWPIILDFKDPIGCDNRMEFEYLHTQTNVTFRFVQQQQQQRQPQQHSINACRTTYFRLSPRSYSKVIVRANKNARTHTNLLVFLVNSINECTAPIFLCRMESNRHYKNLMPEYN